MCAMATLLQCPPSQLFSHNHFSKWSHSPSSPNATRLSIKPTFTCHSSLQTPPSTLPADENSSFPPPDDDGISSQPQSLIENGKELQLRGCKTCGREEIEKGCNGEGRIQGGIATVPGFGWWPIKAYRPCPGFVASGGRYRRRGQNMDEVAFGREEREDSIGSMDKVQSSKKSRTPMRFKR
ncbi:hypothetical protein CKAN_00891800 [Cinnamomum micranthum f. kanehirae]|uniref:Lin-54 family n=1 Tax=Cinnamomum micranthum f. kanehirae TaxID=337451 RepID=A0A3S3MVH6_9MAGN|nr:hypothetical protein CKAN_00891800 [Cinnamomum micranthum f. kanehirae]